jgi:hypothetical protein
MRIVAMTVDDKHVVARVDVIRGRRTATVSSRQHSTIDGEGRDMACPVCNDPDASARPTADARNVTVRCQRCHVFTITPDAVRAIQRDRRSYSGVARARVRRLARHLGSGEEPRPEVITESNWTELGDGR